MKCQANFGRSDFIYYYIIIIIIIIIIILLSLLYNIINIITINNFKDHSSITVYGKGAVRKQNTTGQQSF